MNPIRVLIADDHALVRAGIRALVERIDGVVVVGEAGKGSEALDLIRQLSPDLILLDITMPDGNGFEVLDQVTKLYPEIRVIVLTVHEAGEYALRAVREGAAGYLPKSAASIELEQAIQTVIRGERYISPETAQNTIFEVTNRGTKRDLLATLSPRQREVLPHCRRKNHQTDCSGAGNQRKDRGNSPGAANGAAGHSRRGRAGPLRDNRGPHRRRVTGPNMPCGAKRSGIV